MQSPQEEVKELIDQVLRLTQGFEIWWEIVRKENKAPYPELRETHLPFFEPVQFLLSESLFVICYQLFDYRPDSKHFKGLIKSIAAKNQTVANACEAKIATNKSVIEKVVTIRHKVFAHREKGTHPFDTFANQRLTIKELRGMVELAQDVVSDLSEALGVRSKTDQMREFASYRDTSRAGCKALFESLHKTKSSQSNS
jgi:hypothetical protein